MPRKLLVCVFASLSLTVLGAGCATQFYGDPKFPGGPRGCFNQCASAQMEMSSFVYVGEYSTGCVCTIKRAAGGASSASAEHSSSAATGAAAVGVILQMREAERQRQQSSMMSASAH